MDQKRYKIDDSESRLSVELPWSELYATIIRSKGIRELHLNDHRDVLPGTLGPPVDVSFLRSVPLLSTVILNLMRPVADLAPLRSIESLERVFVSHGWNETFDFSSFRELSVARMMAGPGALTVLSCPLIREVALEGGTDALTHFPASRSLQKLSLDRYSVTSLSGISRFPNLKALDLHDCRQLSDISELAVLVSLEDLRLDKCRAISDLSSLGNLTELRLVFINSAGKVDSIRPLERCRHLQSLSMNGTTNIGDGDLDFLLEMPNLIGVSFKGREHYSRGPREIQTIIESRW